jgi:hypothetical protein
MGAPHPFLQVFQGSEDFAVQAAVVLGGANAQPLAQVIGQAQADRPHLGFRFSRHKVPFFNTLSVWMKFRFFFLWMSICIFERICFDIHNAGMTDRHQAPAYPLRLPAPLKEQVTKSAYVAGRSFNAEVAARLKGSFEDRSAELPQCVQDAVDDEIEARGGTPEEALTRLVLAGQAMGGTVFQLTLQPGVKLQDVTALLEAARVVIPADASIILDRQ